MTRRRRFAPSTRLDDAGKLDRFVRRIAVAGELGIDRNHVVRAADLDAVAGIEYHRDVGVARRILELANVALELEIAGILEEGDVVARLLEHIGDGIGVARRVGQFSGILIGGITDDQRHPLLGQRRRAADDEHQPASQQHRGNGPKPAHK